MLKNIFSGFYLHNVPITYSNEIFVFKSYSIESINWDVSLDSPIIRHLLFFIIDSAEKDLSLSQMVTGVT